MSTITVDAQLSERLNHFREPITLLDEAGKVLAHVLPYFSKEDRDPGISQEEIERLRKSKGKTYTTEEVLKHLESL